MKRLTRIALAASAAALWMAAVAEPASATVIVEWRRRRTRLARSPPSRPA